VHFLELSPSEKAKIALGSFHMHHYVESAAFIHRLSASSSILSPADQVINEAQLFNARSLTLLFLNQPIGRDLQHDWMKQCVGMTPIFLKSEQIHWSTAFTDEWKNGKWKMENGKIEKSKNRKIEKSKNQNIQDCEI
jgi:hypothetical protein